MNADDAEGCIGCIYIFGILLDWSYWIAVGWDISNNSFVNHVLPIIFGLGPALLWPVHLLVGFWMWIL